MTSSVFTIPLVSTDGAAHESSAEIAAESSPRHFIAGPENRLLGILIDATSSRPPLFNPITLYGATGVGKSHLLHGLTERCRTFVTEARVMILTGADFARGFARAIEVDSVVEWRAKHRGVDLFALDDLQELSGKPAAQQELAHTLDALMDQDRQILLTSRHAPLDWHWMSAGLRSRLEGGLTIPVTPPGPVTERHIFSELAASYGLATDPDISLPEKKLPQTYPQIRQVILQSLQQVVNPLANPPRSNSLSQKESLQRIAKLVARQSHVKLADLLGPSRRQTIVRARGVAIYIARMLLGLSFDDLGEYFGGRDHTTVLHSWRTTMERLETDVRFKHEVNKLLTSLADNFEIQRL